ncbi:MAG: hypothetical protein HYV09_25975 [Deltaproteobacteria bacterium]|nr:hypothetical protein [Deltaproteobacteria bacterium]
MPRLDGCAASEVATLGVGCRAVGVPSDGCAPGFVHDGKGACAPVLPETTCAPGSFARPGEATCAPIDACGSERYPKVEGAALHVDAAYAGGDSDGTAGFPP